MKRNKKSFAARTLPDDAQRVTLSDGRRVWIIGGKQYATRREYLDSLTTKKVDEGNG